MLWTIILVLISFFAIIGIMEFAMCVVEMISMRSANSVKDVRLVADIEGREPHIEFILSSLSIMAERIAFKRAFTKVYIRAQHTDDETYQRIKDYIEENPSVYLIEKEE